MTSLYQILSRILFTDTLIFLSVIAATTLGVDDSDLGDADDRAQSALSSHNSNLDNNSLAVPIDPETNFKILAEQLKSLKTDGDLASWYQAINMYFKNAGVKATKSRFTELKERILSAGLPLPIEGPIAKKIFMSTTYIKDHLKTRIAGQDKALEKISILAHRFLCNKKLRDRNLPQIGKPSHCVLTGPTGCGKSETLRQLGKLLDVPILYVNARSLTDEGYKGLNFSEAVNNFCKANDAPKSAIVAFDEMDKLAKSSGMKDFGISIQRVLLSYLDGNCVSKSKVNYDTSNWWFICTGAFSGIKGLHEEKDKRKTTAITHDDIIAYGFEPEFVGRFPTIIAFKEHSLETMVEVITREGSPVDLAKKEFKTFYGIELSFEEKALTKLAEASINVGLGVRSLHTVLNEVLHSHYLIATSGSAGDQLLVTEKEVEAVIAKNKSGCKKREVNPPPPGMYL